MINVTQLRFSRMARDRRGAKYLAEKIGMNSALLSAVERGHARCPEKWQGILSASVGVPVEALFDEAGMAKPASCVL